MKEQLDSNVYYIYLGVSAAILLGLYLKINPVKIPKPIEKSAPKQKPVPLKPLSILGFLKENNENVPLMSHSKNEDDKNDIILYEHVFEL